MKRFLVTLTIVFNVYRVYGQMIDNKLDTLEGLFLIESYWDKELGVHRKYILPFSLYSYFSENNLYSCYDSNFMNYSNLNEENNKKNSDFQFFHLDLSTGYTLAPEYSNLRIVKFEDDPNSNFKKHSQKVVYYMYYLKFTFKKREKGRIDFPKFKRDGTIKKMKKRDVMFYNIVNMLEYKLLPGR